jgi:hypothetical protein
MCSSSSPSAPTTSTTQTSNIPEYARPYVETMLGATQKQLFNTQDTTDPTTGETKTEITGMKPYNPYSTNMNDYFAGPSPMQQQAYQGAANLGPTQQNADASNMAAQAGVRALNTQYDPLMAGSQNFGMGAAQQYMSPYAMAALAPTLQEQARQSAIQGQQLQAKAVGQGAYGGSRQGLEQAENARNLGMLQNKTLTEGMNTAYNNAMQQFNADQARNMQAQQANIGQQQFGANLGMQGLSTGLNAANQLGTLGQNEYNQQTGAINLQNTLGGQQQALEQNKINQAIQNYATGQQWGMQQLSNMNAMLRGLPLQTTSTATYQAAPSTASQVAGVGTALAGLSGKAAKSGGSVKNIKKRPDAGLAAGALNKVMKG